MRALFVGENWQGARPRSLREALSRRSDILVADVGVEHRSPQRENAATRIARRLIGKLEIAALKREVLRQCDDFQPDVVIFYKGAVFDADFINDVRDRHAPCVNIFPDCSPHAHGERLAKAVGVYDLVVTTKPFQPPAWSTTYGYSNRCVCVPHGYDPALHFRADISRDHAFDVVLIAGGRPEYHELVRGLIEAPGMKDLSVAIVGDAWSPIADELPAAWSLHPAKFGVSYVDWLRRGKIVIAPLQRRMVVAGVEQPGEEDTARTYEIAAAHCFFIHRRTAFLTSLYDEDREAAMFDDASELAAKILHYLDRDDERLAMAEAAHRRAVPAYSFDARANEIVSWLNKL